MKEWIMEIKLVITDMDGTFWMKIIRTDQKLAPKGIKEGVFKKRDLLCGNK